MSLKIEVYVPEAIVADGDASGYLGRALGAIGFRREEQRINLAVKYVDEATKAAFDAERAPQPDDSDGGSAQSEPTAAPSAEEPARRRRRTKAEMEAARAAEAAPNISTGGERVDPENPEDAAQDAADEAAEVAATRDPAKPLTLEDVRACMAKYVNTYGMPATQEDGVEILLGVLGKPPAGETAWRSSLIPDDQDTYAKVVAAWKTALDTNRFNRKKA